MGHLNKPHGTRGEIFVWPLTDDPEEVFAPGARFVLSEDAQGEPALGDRLVEIESVRAYRRGYLLHLVGVPDRTAAEGLRGLYLLRSIEELRAPDEGEWFYHEILGLEVETREGEPVGRVTEVYDLRPATMLEVASEGKSRLIPLLRSIVVAVEPEKGRLVIDPPEGLLDL